jgi:soluble lytic murein transglycosylase
MDADRTKLVKFVANHRPSETSFSSCEAEFHAPECAFLKERWADSWFEDPTDESDSDAEVILKASQRNPEVKLTRSFKRNHAKVVAAIVKNLRKGNFEKVPGQVEGDYYRAFKKFDSWTPELQDLTTKVLAQKECAEPELYTYLALKGEEFFPDDAILKTSTALDSKADECGIGLSPPNKYVQIARFRAGLLYIMKNDCKSAEPVFTRLSKMGTNDYSTRSLYWNAYCARSESKREEFLASFDELFKTNPLGFHTLSMTHGDSLLISNLSLPVDPIVKTRTSREGQLNVWIAFIEDLDQLKLYDAVNHLLAPVRKTPEYLGNLEPGVRLYLSTFAFRSKDTISLFRMLDSVFRTQSEYVVDSTLKLFYPMKHWDAISSNVKKVSPLLIAALIRQESAFQENAHSHVGAIGLMQLMPATARLLDHSVRKKKLYDADTNVRLGVKFFEALVDRYNGDVELALAAYNAGADVVDRWQNRYPVKNRLLFLDLIPFAETRNYVTLIGRNYYWYSKLYAEQLKAANGIAQTNEAVFRALKSQ